MAPYLGGRRRNCRAKLPCCPCCPCWPWLRYERSRPIEKGQGESAYEEGSCGGAGCCTVEKARRLWGRWGGRRQSAVHTLGGDWFTANLDTSEAGRLSKPVQLLEWTLHRCGRSSICIVAARGLGDGHIISRQILCPHGCHSGKIAMQGIKHCCWTRPLSKIPYRSTHVAVEDTNVFLASLCSSVVS